MILTNDEVIYLIDAIVELYDNLEYASKLISSGISPPQPKIEEVLKKYKPLKKEVSHGSSKA